MAATDYLNPTSTGGGALASWATDPTKLKSSDLASMAGPMQEATTYTPSSDSLTSNQLTKLLSGDSPLMQQARTRATQYANSRGLLNTSIAAGAGESAMIDAATPIAQSDAGTYATADRDNAAAKNTFSLDANRFGREGALAIANAGFQAGRDQNQNAFTAAESAAQRQLNDSQFGKDLAFRTDSFGQELGLKRDTLTADTGLRQGALAVQQGDLALRTKAEANDTSLRTSDLALRTAGQNADIALKGQDLILRRDSLTADQQAKQATLLQEMQRTYMDARLQLETNPNLDAAAKAKAITAMSDWFYSSALPDLRSSLGNPTMWPAADARKTTQPNPAPAPAPAAPAAEPVPSAYRWDGSPAVNPIDTIMTRIKAPAPAQVPW